MKHLLHAMSVVLLFLFSTSLHAQSEPDTTAIILRENQTYQQLFDSLTSGLVPSRVPYGVLYDRVLHWRLPSEWHNGDTTSKYGLYQDWWDMEHSTLSSAAAGSYAAMRQGVDSELIRNRVPLLFINYNLAYLDSAALGDGRAGFVNGILTDNSLPALPYLTGNRRTVGSTLQKIRVGDSVTFFYDPAHYSLNNTGVTVQRITVTDATEGRQFSIEPNGAYTFAFISEGPHHLNFEVQLNNEEVLETMEIFWVTEGTQRASLASCEPVHDYLESDIAFRGRYEPYGTTSYGDYHIYYHYQSNTSEDCEQVIRKPIIICDGYDPLDSRPYDGQKGIYQLLNYGPTGSTTSLGEELRKQGYDIIILNFPVLGAQLAGDPSRTIPTTTRMLSGGTLVTDPISHINRDGGTDYIERNAFVMVKLIQRINQRLAYIGSSEKVVVVGPSMGGQISRYALAYMEKEYANGNTAMNPNTRLWVSFDSPHWGANIPLSNQRILYWFGNSAGFQEAVDNYRDQVDTKAGQQLLIEQLNYQNNTHPERIDYLNSLQTNGPVGSYGWPSMRAPGGTIRKVALLNGNGAGIRDYTEGEQVLSGTGFKKMSIPIGGLFVWTPSVKIFELNTFFLKAPGGTDKYFEAKTATQGSGFSYFSLVSSGPYSTMNSNANGAMDVVPGSYYPSTDTIRSNFAENLTNNGVSNSWTVRVPTHTFIPSVSALGFISPYYSGSVARNWNAKVNDRNLICTNEIPFDNYYLPPTNEQHITLTADNVSWLKDELAKGGVVTGCAQICLNNWPDKICDGSTIQLSLTNVPSTLTTGYSINWSAPASSTWNPSNLSVSNVSANSSSADVTADWDYTYNPHKTIKVAIQTPCGAPYTLEKEFVIVKIDNPLPNITSASTPTPGRYSVTTTFPAPNAGVTTNWSISYLNRPYYPIVSQTGMNAGSKNKVLNVGDTLVWSVSSTTVNGCGSQDDNGAYIIDGNGGLVQIPVPPLLRPAASGADEQVTILPNPSESTWSLSFNNQIHNPIHVVLVDVTGRVVADKKIADRGRLVIGDHSLSKGIYFATVHYDDGASQKVRLLKE